MPKKITSLKKLTPSERKIAEKIIEDMSVTVLFFEQFPESKNKQWQAGFSLGMKELIRHAAHEIGGDEYLKDVEFLLGWEKDVEKLFGKKRYKAVKAHHTKMEAWKVKKS